MAVASQNGDRTNEPSWARRLLGVVLVGGGEMALAVALVFVLALGFLGVLTLIFPEGSGLTALYGQLVDDGTPAGALNLTSTYDEPVLVATLVDTKRRVRERPADAITWKAATPGTELHDHHAIQTDERSSATIALQGANRLELGANSLVVIKQPEGRRKQLAASLVLLDGRIRGTVSGDGDALPLQYITPNGETRIASTDGRDAEFAMTVNPDQTSTLSVFAGSAEIRTEDGTTLVGENQAVTISGDGASTPRELPATPRPQAPPDGYMLPAGVIAPRVSFEWDGPRSKFDYHLTIARDAALDDVVYDGVLGEARFVHGNLTPGTYYWTVQSIDGEVAGRSSATQRFEIVSDLDRPALEVQLPEQVEDAMELDIRGRTEPGVELLINDEPVEVAADGSFDRTVELEPGMNMIVIEATDSAGNSTYSAHYVTATGRRRP